MKPASGTPLGAIIMGDSGETDLPEGAFSILACSRDGADLFAVDDRLKLLSFTGSAVGWDQSPLREKEGGIGARKCCRSRRCGYKKFRRRGASNYFWCFLPERSIVHRRTANHDPRRCLREVRDKLVSKTSTWSKVILNESLYRADDLGGRPLDTRLD